MFCGVGGEEGAGDAEGRVNDLDDFSSGVCNRIDLLLGANSGRCGEALRRSRLVQLRLNMPQWDQGGIGGASCKSIIEASNWNIGRLTLLGDLLSAFCNSAAYILS